MLHGIPLMSPFFRDEVLPILVFFGMFFLIYGVGVPLFRHLPHKKGSMWDEMLNDRWEESEHMESAEPECMESEAPADDNMEADEKREGLE